MSWKSLLVLLLLVGGLLYMNSARQERIAEGLVDVPDQYSLFREFAPERVVEVRIDSLKGSFQVKLERDSAGSWFLTDPIPYPAIGRTVTSLLSAVNTCLAEEVPDVTREAAGLDLPRVVVEFVQVAEDDPSARSTYRLDIGNEDLNHDRVYALASGGPALAASESATGERVLRITRAIYNTLEHIPNDYRNPRATRLNLGNITGLLRTGSIYDRDLDASRDLGLEIERTGNLWRKVDDPAMNLDPSLSGFLARGACNLEAEWFVRDLPESYEPFGLEQPAFSIELRTGSLEPVQLDFGFPKRSGDPNQRSSTEWYFRKVGFPHIWGISLESIDLLTIPTADLYDAQVLRVLREDILRLELRDGERSVVFEREERSAGGAAGVEWTLATIMESGAAPTRFPADPGQVKDLIASIEETQLNYPAGLTFDASAAERSISIHTRDGRRWGGLVGERWKDTSIGLVAYRFLRFDDQQPGLLEERVAELCFLDEFDPLAFRTARIHHMRWATAKVIRLAHDGGEFVYRHAEDDKSWGVRIAGRNQVAPAPEVFEDSCLLLLSLRAETWLEGFDATRLGGRLEVSIKDADPESSDLVFVLGRDLDDPDGRIICIENGSAAEVSHNQLRNFAEGRASGFLDGLLELFESE